MKSILKKVNKYLFVDVLLFIQSLFFVFLFPNLEYPDAITHLGKVLGIKKYSSELYITLIRFFNGIISNYFGFNITFDLPKVSNFSYFSMMPAFEYFNGNQIGIIVMQLYNVLFVFLFIFLFKFIVNKDKVLNDVQKDTLIKLNYIYYFYPIVAYLIMGITPDFFNYIYQPFFIYLLIRKKHLFNFVLIVTLYFFFDGGIILNLIFLTVYLILNKFNFKKSNLNRNILVIFISIYLLSLYVVSRSLMQFLPKSNQIFYAIVKNVTEYGNIFTKIINLFLSSFTFWGSGNYITFPIIYMFYIIIILYISKEVIRKDSYFINVSLFDLFSSLLFVIGTVLVLVGTHSHIRFQLYFVLIIIIAYNIVFKKTNYITNKNFLIQIIFLFFHNVFLIYIIFLINL